MRTIRIKNVSGVAETHHTLEGRTSRPKPTRPIAWKLRKSARVIYCHEGSGGAAATHKWRLEGKQVYSFDVLLHATLLLFYSGLAFSTLRSGPGVTLGRDLRLCQQRGSVLGDLIGNMSAMRATIGCIALGIDSSALTHCTSETHADWGALCVWLQHEFTAASYITTSVDVRRRYISRQSTVLSFLSRWGLIPRLEPPREGMDQLVLVD